MRAKDVQAHEAADVLPPWELSHGAWARPEARGLVSGVAESRASRFASARRASELDLVEPALAKTIVTVDEAAALRAAPGARDDASEVYAFAPEALRALRG